VELHHQEFNQTVEQRVADSKDIPDFKVIPGGRYGCAQFIQQCGPH